MNQTFRARRSILFVPAVRPDRYPKALATGADAVCVDLEDGVAFDAKDEARGAALSLFADRAPTRAEVVLRINDPKTDLGQADVAALREASVRPDAIMLPKVAGADEVREVESALASTLQGIPLIVQIETAQGVSEAARIVKASPQIAALFFGAIDLSADVGCAVDWEALLYARSCVVLASVLAGVSAIDSPCMNVRAVDTLTEESRRARRLGFVGKAAIHPTQVSVIQEAFSPTTDELAWAHKIVAAYEDNQGGVLLVDGHLIERPVVQTARRTIMIASAVEEHAESPDRTLGGDV